MAIDKKAYALANGYTDETVIGGGAIKGKNCTISKIEDIDGGHRITFGWTLDDGTTKSQTLDVKDGVDGHTPVKGVDYYDGEKGEPGIAGLDGKDGTTYTPSIGEVTTVDSTELASATVSVNTETKEAVFNFAIPKGNKGLDGVQISDNETVENKTWSSSKIANEIPTTLPANGGNADTVNNHTVKSDVPTDAKFTDTVYDDTEVKGNIDELSENLSNITRRARRNITSDLANLTTAIAEQNLEKYGYTIGDYFVGASGYYYHLADMDTNYGGYTDQAVVNTHHCGIVVDTKSICQWLSKGTVTNYSSSTLHSFLTNTALPNIKSDIATLFGDWESHLLKRTELDNAIGGWGTTWDGLKNCLICAMTEVQIYGARVFGADGYQTGTGSKALELFRKYRFNEIYGDNAVWLKSIVSDSIACDAHDSGHAYNTSVFSTFQASGLILFH